MAQELPILSAAPDFSLTDTSGNQVRLAELAAQKYVVLVLLRAFA